MHFVNIGEDSRLISISFASTAHFHVEKREFREGRRGGTHRDPLQKTLAFDVMNDPALIGGVRRLKADLAVPAGAKVTDASREIAQASKSRDIWSRTATERDYESSPLF